MTKTDIEMLKAFFSAQFMGLSDMTQGGCETCGFGGTEGMSLAAVRDALDKFAKENNLSDQPSIEE